jgi:sugar diacid utilization regulator
MTPNRDSSRLDSALRTLRQYGVVPKVAGRLRDQHEAFATTLAKAVVREVPAYRASGNPDVIPEHESHLTHQIDEVCSLLDGRRLGDLAFVSHHAKRRAEQKFPLEAILACYHCLHRDAAIWIRDAALESADESAQLRRVVAAVAELMVEYSEIACSLLTSEYVAQTRLLAEAEGDRRSELLNVLLRGYDESDSRAAKLLRRAGYLEQRQSFCVVVARSVDPREMENPARAQRMADSVAHCLQDLPIRVLVGVHDSRVIAVLSGTRRMSGWTAPQTLVADRAYPKLRALGLGALVGLSSDAPSTSHIPKAFVEAKLALDFSSVADRVVAFREIPFRDMLVRATAKQVQTALPSWLGRLQQADAKTRGALTATLRAYADADMNVLKTAEALTLHPNTIYARMQKITDLTERNPLSYSALTELLLVIDCAMLDR